MPGVLGLHVIPTGVAVLASTFGQALDAKEALRVTWGPGTVDGEDNASIFRKLAAAATPVPPAPPLTQVVDAEFTFAPTSHAPLESNTPSPTSGRAAARCGPASSRRSWRPRRSPRTSGCRSTAITAHVVQGGGSFGRRLFFDAALEAARISKAAGRPVKLMWTRIDDMRHGRARARQLPPDPGRLGGRLGPVVRPLGRERRDRLPARPRRDPHGGSPPQLPVGGNASFAQTVFLTTIKSPYDFGRVTQGLRRCRCGCPPAASGRSTPPTRAAPRRSSSTRSPGSSARTRRRSGASSSRPTGSGPCSPRSSPRASGDARCRRASPRASPSTTSTSRARPAWSRSTRATRSAPGSPARRSRSTSACRSTRAACRPRCSAGSPTPSRPSSGPACTSRTACRSRAATRSSTTPSRPTPRAT